MEKDKLYKKAKELVLKSNNASISYIQRTLKIGYNNASSIVQELEKDGILSKADSKSHRKIIYQKN